MNKIFILVDLQNDFILPKGKLTVNAPELINKTQIFLKKAAASFQRIFATQDTHYRQTYPQTEEAKLFPPHCIYGTSGWKIPVQLPMQTETILKPTTNVWEKKDSPLLHLSYKETTVYLAGVCADICVEQAMQGLLARGATVRILTDLTKGYTLSAEEVLKKPIYAQAVQKGHLKGITTQAFLNEQKKHVRS